MELIGIQRPRGRDLATGIVLGAGLGLAALFLYLEATDHNTTGATVTILFGSLFAITSSAISAGRRLQRDRPRPDRARSSARCCCARSARSWRPARGIPVRLVGAGYLLALATAVALAAFTIGTILSTALLVGPAATALRLTRSPGRAIVAAALIGIGSTWLGILLAYDSYDWPPLQHGWPVSFFVVSLIFVAYLLAGLRRRRPASPTTRPETAELAAAPTRG